MVGFGEGVALKGGRGKGRCTHSFVLLTRRVSKSVFRFPDGIFVWMMVHGGYQEWAQVSSSVPVTACLVRYISSALDRSRQMEQPEAFHRKANPPFVPPTPPAHGTTSSLVLKPRLSVRKICLTRILAVSSGGGYGAFSPSLPHHSVTFFHPSRAHKSLSATCTPFGACAISPFALCAGS